MLRRCQLPASFTAVLATIVLSLPVCAHAGSSKVTTSIKTTLTGSFFLNTGDQSSSEQIDFSGDVHLVVQAIPPTPVVPPTSIRVHVNMAGVSGVGRTSGQQFVLNGSENFEADGDVPNTLDLQGSYRLSPTPPPISQSPNPPPIVPINFTIQVDENGIATSAVATVDECSADVCGQL